MTARVNVYEAVASNRRRTVLIVAGFLLFIAALGYLLGEVAAEGAGPFVLPFALGVAAVSSAGAYFAGASVVLGMSQARQVDERAEPVLHHVVEALAIGAGLPKPRLYVIEDSAPNAFATGRDPAHASVAVTRGLLEKLDRVELEGVLAHELSHIRNFDVRVALLAAVLVGMALLLSDWLLRALRYRDDRSSRRGAGAVVLIAALVLAILAPLVAQAIRFALSREREYLADASGALLTRYPPGLASALAKIAADPEALEVANKATAPLYFVNPLKDAPRFLDHLFDTHPPIPERIRRLESM